eukprot:COSAG06_NODE_1830_length_8270_cov_19.516950_6_plen_201_part_00
MEKLREKTFGQGGGAGGARRGAGMKTRLCHALIKRHMIDLPRQARDKRSESTQKTKTVSLQARKQTELETASTESARREEAAVAEAAAAAAAVASLRAGDGSGELLRASKSGRRVRKQNGLSVLPDHFLLSNKETKRSFGSVRPLLLSNKETKRSFGSVRPLLLSNKETKRSFGSVRPFLLSNKETKLSFGSVRPLFIVK